MSYMDRLYENADWHKVAQEQLRKFAQQQPSKSPVGEIKESDELYDPKWGAFLNGIQGLRRTAETISGSADAQVTGFLANQLTGAEDLERYKRTYENNPEFRKTAATPDEYAKRRLSQPTFWQKMMGLSEEKSNYTPEEAKALEQSWMKDRERPYFDKANEIESARYSRRPDGWLEEKAVAVAENIPQIAESVGTSIAAGAIGGAPAATLAGAASMIKNIYGAQYDDLRRNGHSIDASHAAALADTAYQLPFEYIGISRILKQMPGLQRALAKASPKAKNKFIEWGKTVGIEGATEFAQDFGDSSAEDIATAIESGEYDKGFQHSIDTTHGIIKKNTIGENSEKNLDSALESGLIGGILGGGSHVLGHGASAIARKLSTPSQEMIDEAVQEEETNRAAQNAATNTGDNTQGGGDIHPTAQAIMQFFIDKGESPVVAAAIAGNVAQESGYNPTVENGIGAFGLFQYLGDRRDALLSFAEANNLDPNDIYTQLEFAWYEMNQEGTLENQALQEMRKAQSVDDATVSFRRLFERPGEEEANDAARISEAQFVHDNFTGAKQFIEDYTDSMDLTDDASDELLNELNRLIDEGTEEEVVAKAQELGYTPKQPIQQAPKETQEAPKPIERPQGQALQTEKIEMQQQVEPEQAAPTEQAATTKETQNRVNRPTPSIKRSADKGNFNNRGTYNGRLAPQNVNNEQGTSAPISQPTQAITEGDNTNGKNLQTQTTERGENRENPDVNAQPKQSFQKENNQNVTSSQGNEVTPTLAPSSRGVSSIAQNTAKTASNENTLTADKVDGKALEKATEANADTVSAKSEVNEAKAKENAALDKDSTVSEFKKVADGKVAAVESGKISKNTAEKMLEGAKNATKKRLIARLHNGEISHEEYKKLLNRSEEIKEEAENRIQPKEETAKETNEAKTEAKMEAKTETKEEIKTENKTEETAKEAPKEETKVTPKKAAPKKEEPKKVSKADQKKDAQAKKTLSKEAYDKVYLPIVEVLEKAKKEVSKAARDTALIMAKQAQFLHERFGLKYEDAPRVLLGGRANGNGYRQMAGEHAKTAALDKLAEAKKMEATEFPWEIFEKTGWIKKEDGKWRFEIPDNIDKIDFSKEVNQQGYVLLEDIYDNPKLYEAYPALKTIRIYKDEGVYTGESTNGATFGTEGDKNIAINSDVIAKSERSAKKALIHEIQHVIQHYEGFAHGGAPETVKDKIRNELGRNIQFVQSIPHSQGTNWMHYNSIIANSLQEGGKYTEEEIKKATEELDKIENEIGAETTQMLREVASHIKTLERSLAEDTSEEAYRGLLGEKEARDTEERATNEWARRETPDTGDYYTVVFGEKDFPYKVTQERNTAIDAETRLAQDEKNWGTLIDSYRKTNKEEWKKNNDGKLYDFMKMPLILQLLGYPNTDIKAYGSFFRHSVNEKHPGMTYALLKQLPRAMTDPMFIYRGTGENSIVMALELKDSRGATVVAVVEFSKKDKKYGIVNLVNTAYSKNHGINRVLDYYWVSVAFDEKNLLYMNKKKSTAWIQAIRSQFPMGSVYLNSALTNESIKDENDFVKLKNERPLEYQENEEKEFNQPAWHGSPYTFEEFDLGKIGSGEGAQAHGWGLYFAANREASEKYKEILGNSSDIITFNGEQYRYKITMDGDNFFREDGEIVEFEDPLSEVLELIMKHGNAQNATEVAKETLKKDEERLKKSAIWAQQVEYDRKVLAMLENGVGEVNTPLNSRLYKVEIPENDVLLNEDMNLNGQPQKVKEALKELMPELEEMGLPDWFIEEASGGTLYENISYILGSDKETSLLLSKHGIKGIVYEGEKDGRCFVVFDDKAVSIIETYNQAVNQEIAGSYNVPQNLIQVFEEGNASTVVHESAHWYLTMLENLVRAEAEKRGITGTLDEILTALSKDKTVSKELIKELQTIRNWAQFSEEALAEYKGTSLEKEFTALAEAIKNGDKEAVERFMQERFARAFERYLAEGKAPSKELEGAFKRFRKWMLEIYKSIQNLGKKAPPKEIQEIFDRMLAMENGEAKPKKEYPTGKTATVRTDNKKAVSVTYKLMPAEDVISSHDANFAENENYPSELQPRDRSRTSMKEQVDGMARKLNPDELTASVNLNEGAPIINEDNVVENGNGRTMAIVRAYANESEAYQKSSERYKAYLREHAEEFGFTKEQVDAIEHPILVRQRENVSEDVVDSIIHSTNGGMKMGATQRAKADAKKISEHSLSLYNYDGSGDLTLAANRDFVTSVLNEIADATDKDVVFTANGMPSAEGIKRVIDALCAKAYENTELINRVSESTDTEAKNFVEAYKAVAPRVAAVKNLLEKGDVNEDFDLPKLLNEALDYYLAQKEARKPIKDALNEGAGIFNAGESIFSLTGTRKFVEFLADKTRNKKAVMDAIIDMVEGVTHIAEDNKSVSLMDGVSETSLYDIVRTAIDGSPSNFKFEKDGKTLTAKPEMWNAASEAKKENVANIAKGKGATEVNVEKGIFTFPDEITREEAIDFVDAQMDSRFSTQGTIADKLRAEAKMVPENKLSAREKGIVAFARRMGVRVQFFEGNKNLHGWQQGNVIYLNRNMAKDLNTVFWHETFHWLKRNNPELYEKIKKAVLQNDDIAAQVQAYIEETGRTDLTVEEAIEEMLADAMSNAAKRGNFFELLGVTHPTLVQKIIKWIKNTYKDFVAQYRQMKGFRAEAGLTNTQIKRMSIALDSMALKLKDGQGNRLFRADGKGNLVSMGVKDAAYMDGVKYLVTNRKVLGKYRIPVIDVTNAPEIDLRDKSQTDALFEKVGNKVFHFFGGTGIVKKYDIRKAPDKNKQMFKQLIHGHGSFKDNNSSTRRKVFSMLADVLPGCVYIDKHNDRVHGTKTEYIEAFVPIKDGDKLCVYQFTARERGIVEANEVGLAMFYNAKEGKSNVPQNGRNNADLPSEMSIAEMLEGVKDRDGNLYVINGELQYNDKLVVWVATRPEDMLPAPKKQQPENETTQNDAENEKQTENEASEERKYSIDLKDLSDGKVFGDDKKMNEIAASLKDKLEIGKEKSFLDFASKYNKTRVEYYESKKVELDKNLKKKESKGRDHLTFTLLGSLFSPSRLKDALVKQVFDWADAAKRRQAKLYAKWTVSHKEILDLVADEKSYADYRTILLNEDANRKVYTDEELKKMGYADNVIQAHKKVRELLKDIRGEVAKVYQSKQAETKNFRTKAEADAWAKTPFFENVTVTQMRKENGVVWQVKYFTPKYNRTSTTMTKEELDKLKQDKDVFIVAETMKDPYPSLVEPTATTEYNVEYMEPVRTLADMDEYIPHFFHDFLIIRNIKKNGKIVNQNIIGSATTLEEAINIAESMNEGDNVTYTIAPKGLSCEDDTNSLIVVGDKDYDTLINGIKNGMEITLEEAKEVLNARTTNRHVFLSSLQHRKGATGWETNMRWVIQHHIAGSARYCALDPFKVKAINLFERRFGAFSDDYFNSNPRADFLKGLIESVLDKPTKAENFTNALLSCLPGLKRTPRPSRIVTSTIVGTMAVCKLGLSFASAAVNLTQVINLQGYIGAKWTLEGIKKAGAKSEADMKLLEDLGTAEETGLETVDVSEDTALVMGKYAKELKALCKLADYAMIMFSKTEKFLRQAAVLGAYHKALSEGKTEGQARRYALEVNRKSNFEYGVHDAPRIFRALKGSIVGEMFLQFKKYGLKELEVIWDMVFSKDIPASQKLQFWGGYYLAGGIFGILPFQDLIVAIIGAALDVDDPEAELKRWMMEKAKESPAMKQVVLANMYGIGGAFGIDISQRVAFSSLAPEFDEPLGVTGSTVKQMLKAIDNSDTIGFFKAISPAWGNIASAYAGYNTDSKGRKAYEYKDGWERLLRLIGFRTTGEALSVDSSRILMEGRKQRQKARDEAKEAYFDNPSTENRKRLQELGYTKNQIKNLKNTDDSELDRKGRLQKNMSKKEKKDYKDIMDW